MSNAIWIIMDPYVSKSKPRRTPVCPTENTHEGLELGAMTQVAHSLGNPETVSATEKLLKPRCPPFSAGESHMRQSDGRFRDVGGENHLSTAGTAPVADRSHEAEVVAHHLIARGIPWLGHGFTKDFTQVRSFPFHTDFAHLPG